MSTTSPLRKRKWLWPVLAGVAALLILTGAGAIFVYIQAGAPDDTALESAPSAIAPGTIPADPDTPSDEAAPGGAEDEGATGEDGDAMVQGSPDAPTRPAATGRPCEFRPAGRGGGEPRLVSTPAPRATLTGRINATIQTGMGTIGIQLRADLAPCTVHSFAHLAREDYYTETPCHRLTTDGLWVLQCGDPGGTGTGSPGYQFGEENLPTTLPPYPRGTLAMANAGSGTNGAQFFIVYRDSDIPPDYTIFGTVTSGLDLLDRIAAGGTDNGTTDGRPRTAVRIDEIKIG